MLHRTPSMKNAPGTQKKKVNTKRLSCSKGTLLPPLNNFADTSIQK
jgi:hypothetical protein